MSVSGVASSSLFDLQSVQNKFQQFRQEFQQLGQDLQKGDLSGAQTDFTALQQLEPGNNASSSTQSKSPIAQDFTQLSQDMQAGNVSAAQQDYAKIQQDSRAAQGHHHHHHDASSANGAGGITELLTQLGQALQSGNLSAAQQAYASVLKDLESYGQSTNQSPQSASNSLTSTA